MPKINAGTVAEHREQTYEALLDAVDALLRERSFDEISLRDIAARAGVARTAIYNYAPDKTALLIAAGMRAAAPMRTAVAGIAGDESLGAGARLDEIVRMLLVTFAHSTQHLLLVRALRRSLDETDRDRVLAPFRDDVSSHVGRVLRAGVTAGAFDPELDVELTVDLISGVLDAAVARASAEPSAAPGIAASATTFLRRALAPDGP